MKFELYQLFLVGAAYLLLLFYIAHSANSSRRIQKLLRHPIVYVLSLGVFISAGAIYGVVSLAHDYGFGYLSYYIGTAGMFLFAPLVLIPMMQITRRYLHSSLADVLTFRFRSQWAGSLITLCMVIAMVPFLALQMQVIAGSLQVLTGSNSETIGTVTQSNLALVFCIVIGFFTIAFGSKQLTAHDRHHGMVAAIAFESLVKLLAMLVVGGCAVFWAFGGPQGLQQWLTANPEFINRLSEGSGDRSSTRFLLLIFFSTAVALPHLFHMTFAEHPSRKAVRVASWGFPLYLLLISLPILPILWAGFYLQSSLPMEYFSLAIGIELQSPLLALLVFLGGLSAASGACVVATLALASMCLKHLLLPVYRPDTDRDIYRWLLWIRRLFILLIILAGYVFYRLAVGRIDIATLGIASFVATLQFLPGILATPYWQRANRQGLLAGLVAGFSLWAYVLIVPIFNPAIVNGELFQSLTAYFGSSTAMATIVSITANVLVFVAVSLLTPISEEEQDAAQLCAADELNRATRRRVQASSPAQMKTQLAMALGSRTAAREVDRTLREMGMQSSETRPLALQRLRYRLEANLSNLLGPSVANEMINQLLPYQSADSRDDLNLMEGLLESSRSNLTGLAASLDNLRRYHRQTLQDLPLGVCSLDQQGEVLLWNNHMASLTGIASDEAIGSSISGLSTPWNRVLANFVELPEPHLYKDQLNINGSQRWFNFHKTSAMAEGESIEGRAIVIEDITDTQQLENELLHNQRLASIGRLAAGVAHEIGNPVTGIACLVQNLRYDTDNPESLATADEILTQTDRISKIVQTLVNFAHAGVESANTPLAPVNIAQCTSEAIHLLQLDKTAKPIDYQNHCDEQHSAIADSQRLLQVFINLLSNARDASPADSPVVIASRAAGQQLIITVTDEGTGISEQHQEQIFDPFFTTKEAGQGTGLGLSLVYSIVDDLQGVISVESPVSQGRGTRFIIKLTRASTPA